MNNKFTLKPNFASIDIKNGTLFETTIKIQ